MRLSHDLSTQEPVSPTQKQVLQILNNGPMNDLSSYQLYLNNALQDISKEEIYSISTILRESNQTLTYFVKALVSVREKVSGSSVDSIKAIGSNIKDLDPKLLQALSDDKTSSSELLALAAGGFAVAGYYIVKSGVNHHKDMMRHDENVKYMEQTLITNIKLIEAQRDVAYNSTQRLIQALENSAKDQISLIQTTILGMGKEIIQAETIGFQTKVGMFRNYTKFSLEGHLDNNKTRRHENKMRLKEQEIKLHAQSNNIKIVMIALVVMLISIMIYKLFQNPQALSADINSNLDDWQDHDPDSKMNFKL